MRRQTTTRRSGFTLLELMVVCGIFAALLVGVGTFSLQTHSGYESVLQGATVTANLRKTLETVADELRNSTPTRVTVDQSDPNHDRLLLQVPVGWVGCDTIWGADGVEGQQIEYVVSARELWRRVLDADGNAVGARRVARHIDLLRDGQKGFDIETDGTMCTLSLRTRMTRDARRVQRDARTSVVMQNPS